MKRKILPANWPEHLIPMAAILIAFAMLIATPFWAYRWFHEPFLGTLIEPNNVISQINGKDWPARQQGVEWSDRLVAINGQSVETSPELHDALNVSQFAPVEATFEKREGTQFTLTITPIRPSWGDLLSLFLVPYLVGLLFLATGLWAYRIRPDLHASRAFVTFTAALTVVTTTFLDMNTTHHVAVLWALSLPVAAGALAHLSLVFPQQMPFINRWPPSRHLPWLFTLALALPTAREILAPTTPYAYIQTWIWGYAFIALSMLLFIATLTARVFYSHSPIVRQQSRVIVFGAALAFIPVLLLYLIPITFGGQIPEFRASIYFPPLIFLPLSVTYAIVRYRLLDVDRILSRALTYLLTTAAAFAAFYGLLTLISFLIQKAVQPNDPLVIAAYLLLLMFGLNPARDLIQQAIDRFFYRAPADYRRVLTSLSRSLVITPNLSQTLRLLEEELQQALAPEKFVVYLYNDDQGEYLPHASHEDSAPPYAADDPLVVLLQDAPAPIWLPPSGELPPALENGSYDRLAGFTFVPLRYEGKLIGFLALGPRRSGDLYSSDDLDFLAAVAAQSALALENARLFTNLRHTLDQTLEMKNLMDDIFASIATGVITTDIQREITLFNRAAQEILGIPLADVLGKPLPDALPNFYRQLEEPTNKALTKGEVTISADVMPHIPPRGDIYLRLSCSPLKDAYLSTKGATIVFEDLTERRRLEAEQERIRQTFGRVVAPRIRDRLLADPGNLRLDGTEQTVTILFADISGFTTYSEKTPPEVVFKLLNDYLSLAAQAILDEEGTLDKFMGDAVMAIWNSPDPQADHALRAVRAACAIAERAREEHQKLPDPGQHLVFHTGIATGTAMIGNVGTRELFNYTAIGDTVNITQRLEVTAQPGQILINKATYDLVAGHVIAAQLPPVTVKGRTKPVEVYELKGLK
ncbi:MAG: PAS domain-containing protein [Chloroflexi bacterium]|nr:PAS domain-containing protein [Chloroflexota bacterium]